MRAIYQNEVAECGYACLAMVLSHFGRAVEVRELQAFRRISANGLTLMDLYDVAVEFGLAVQAYRFDAGDLPAIKRGSILHFGGAHFVVFEKCARGYVQVIDPASGRRRIAMDTFVANVSGYLLECAATPDMPRVRSRSRVPQALAGCARSIRHSPPRSRRSCSSRSAASSRSSPCRISATCCSTT
jgi:ATP-binding cassette subfamily B protein RaxB